jgi:N-acetylmuramoyl-L-alanine amidase
MRSNHNYHRDTLGWNGLGYNYWIEPNGTIYEVRGRNIGAHSGASWNGISYGICFQGNFETQLMTDEQLASGIWLCARLCRMEGLGAGEIVGHGKRFGGTSNTLCPGKNFRMAELRTGTEEALKPQPAGRTHTVRQGETYWSIGQLYGADIEAANPQFPANALPVGAVIAIPFGDYKKEEPAPLQAAIDTLTREGIIRSPEYWQANSLTGRFVKGEFVASLILRMAKRLEGDKSA